MNNILFCGYYGFGNAGDEAIIETIIRKVKMKISNSHIKILTSNIEYSKKDLNVDECILRTDISKVIKAIRGSDVVIFGGGSLFQDITSFKSIIYYSGICLLSKLFRKNYILAFQGLGPIKRKLSKVLLRSVLKKAKHVSLRDIESLNMAKQLFDREYVLTADPVFLIDTSRKEKPLEQKDKKIAFILKDLANESATNELVKLGCKLQKELDVKLFNISLFKEQDREITEKFKEATSSKEIEYDSTKELIDNLGSIDLVISIRYHGLVFSICTKTPCIPISYDPKVFSLMKELGLKGSNDIDDVDSDVLYGLVLDSLGKREFSSETVDAVDAMILRTEKGMNKLIEQIS